MYVYSEEAVTWCIYIESVCQKFHNSATFHFSCIGFFQIVVMRIIRFRELNNDHYMLLGKVKKKGKRKIKGNEKRIV